MFIRDASLETGCRLCYFAYFMEYSCLKTIAGKHKTTARKVIGKYSSNGSWSVPYRTAKGVKYCKFADFMKCKKATDFDDVIKDHALMFFHSRTTLEDRLSAQVCELCGKTGVPLEIHHVNKIKNAVNVMFIEKNVVESFPFLEKNESEN